MLVTDEITQTGQQTTLEKRRAFLKLPLEKRRQELAQQAEQLLAHYERGEQEREVWQGGDALEF